MKTKPSDAQVAAILAQFTDPEPCINCRKLHERASMTKVRAPRARKAAGYVCCGDCFESAKNTAATWGGTLTIALD